ncbi:C3H1-type domain-containing protein [Entamoeba marina]
MNRYDFVDLSSFTDESSLFDVFSSRESSTFNSFLNDEIEAIPTDEERLYFESLKKIDHINVAKVLDDDDNDNNGYNNNEDIDVYDYDYDYIDDDDNEEEEDIDNDDTDDGNDELGYCVNQSTIRCQSNPNPISTDLYPINVGHLMDLRNQSVNSISSKWRTQPCLYYQKYGCCRKGEACNYSHDVSVTGKQFVSIDKLFRTKPCKYFFKTGTCRKGENCNYSHDINVCE